MPPSKVETYTANAPFVLQDVHRLGHEILPIMVGINSLRTMCFLIQTSNTTVPRVLTRNIVTRIGKLLAIVFLNRLSKKC